MIRLKCAAPLFVLLLACDVEVVPGSGGSASTSTGSGSGELALAVEAAALEPSIGVIKAGANKSFLVLKLTLTNTDVSEGVPENFLFYSVDLASNVSVGAAAATAGLPEYCDSNVKVKPGGAVTCSVAFEIPTADTAVLVTYKDPILNASAQASVPEAQLGGNCDEFCATRVAGAKKEGCAAEVQSSCVADCKASFTSPICVAEYAEYINCVVATYPTAECGCTLDNEFGCYGCEAEVMAVNTCVSM